MIVLIVGHRGTGKTSWLRALKEALPDRRYFDLDTVIEQATGKTVAEIFAADGEQTFRQLEVSHLEALVRKYQDNPPDTFIAVGAGYGSYPPEGVHTIWLRRPSDESGRIFRNRPRLTQMRSSYDEYHYHYGDRDQRYAEWADEIFDRQEGLDELLHQGDQLFWEVETPHVGGVLTVMPEFLRSEDAAHWYLQKRLKWPDVMFELREDLINGEQLQWACEVIPYERRIASLRLSNQVSLARSTAGIWDWALELGMPPEGEDPPIISQHERGDQSLDAVLEQFTEVGKKWRLSVLKMAVEVNSFEELEEGHQWWSLDPHRRVFLPRSKDGRWKWYRQLMGKKMVYGFWREGRGSAPDQPSLSDWLSVPDSWKSFAAVIGKPIRHSWTPVEQAAFFAERNMPIVAIEMDEDELTQESLDFLRELGLRAAAITSPLKNQIHSLVYDRSPSAESLGSANTLALRADNKWMVDNTDLEGIKVQLQGLPEGVSVAVWGGGGTKGALRDVIPHARFFQREVVRKELAPDPRVFYPMW